MELRVLIVDDTIVYRKILQDVLQEIEGTRVVATAPNGKIALKKLEFSPVDLVLLDVEMPEMNGLETLKEIKKKFPNVSVVMVSGTNTHSTNITIQALELGAFEFISKPESKGPTESKKELVQELRPVINLIRAKRRLTASRQQPRQGITKPSPKPAIRTPKPTATVPTSRLLTRTEPPNQNVYLIAIGVSTGGPKALLDMIPKLSHKLNRPVLIVQHMPPNFTKSLASQLDKRTQLSVSEAEDNTIAEAGSIYIAPGGRHMIARVVEDKVVLSVNDNPPVKSCRPSVDVLFRSLLGMGKGNILTVMLTGMGDDGVDGVRALSRHGSYNLIQDEKTCVVYGMPRAVEEAQLAHEVLPLDQIAQRINEIVLGRSFA